MYRATWWVLLVGVYVVGRLAGEVIQSPVVHMYCEPKEDTEVESQAIYGDIVTVIKRQGQWLQIETADKAQGWVLSSQVIDNPAYASRARCKPIKSLFAQIYRCKDTTPQPPVCALPYGAQIQLDNVADTGERWCSATLVSGEKVWIQRGDIDFDPKKKSIEEMLAFSRCFLGLPYHWAGTSPFGFDCSGFVQMLFKEVGVCLPRNSRDQAQSELVVDVELGDLRPGDLVFFGSLNNSSRITHVGVYLGDREFIHAGVTEAPKVMVSNLDSGKYNLLCARRIKHY